MSLFIDCGKITMKHEPTDGYVDLFAVIPHTPGRVLGSHVATMQWKEVSDGVLDTPLLTLSRQQAQRLVDDLHAAGFRPSTAAKLEEPLRTLLQQSTHYARRAGFFEAALSLIAQGHSDIDAKAAARRALDGAGDQFVRSH